MARSAFMPYYLAASTFTWSVGINGAGTEDVLSLSMTIHSLARLSSMFHITGVPPSARSGLDFLALTSSSFVAIHPSNGDIRIGDTSQVALRYFTSQLRFR